MTHNDPLARAQRSASRYWNVDGLAEMYAGFVFLLVPFLNFWSRRLPISPVWFVTGNVLACMILVVVSRPIIVAIRRRLTYPRTGYVLPGRRRRIGDAQGIALTVVTLAAIVALMANTTDWFGGLIAICGLVAGIIDIHLARVTGLARFYFLGALSIVAGAGLALAQPALPAFAPEEYFAEAFSLLWGIIGAGYLITGGMTLWKYLRAHPATPAETA